MAAPQAITQTIEVGGKTLTLETGKLAKQADGAVVTRLGDTVTLSTAVTDKKAKDGQHFFPLTVDYRERFSAKGAFPGGFFKREGRPTDKETLTSRLIDRTIRPLFPDGFRNEVQVLNYVLSADEEMDADVVAGIGSSAALSLSGSPFDGPTAHVRVGRVDGEFVLFPTVAERAASDFDLVVAGKADAIAMVEGEMDEVSEDDMVAALEFGFDAIKTIVAGINEFVGQRDEAHGAPEPLEYQTVAPAEDLVAMVYDKIKGDVDAILRADEYDKASFYGGIADVRDKLIDDLFGYDVDTEGDSAEAEEAGGVEHAPRALRETTDDGYSVGDVKEAFKAAESRVMREMILEEGRRLDGRSTTDVRDIWTEVDYLPKVHGSAVFTRGETQALVMVTLGTGRDVQAVDQLFDQVDKRFYLHYNFPPFSVGETRFLRGPSRREIGHGMLAERALAKMMPGEQEFPYTVRIISDVLESNGSSSMATVCGGSMALMAAGVPVEKPVAGIAMGLIADGDRIAVLSDILGTEDHLGDMDFKLCGTRDGITACQMDIKIDGLAMSTMREALEQAKAGREHILDRMAETISEPREDISPSAPRLIQVVIDQDYIGAIIGPGGKIIKGIQADTGAQIDIDERDGKGYVTVAAPNMDSAYAAVDIIRGIVTEPEVGENYTGTVKNLLPFGAILEIMPGKEAMLHVSEISHGYVDDPADEMQVGDKLEVQLIEIRDGGKLRVSRKPFLPEPTEEEKEEMRKRSANRSNGGGGDRGGDRGRGRGRGRRN